MTGMASRGLIKVFLSLFISNHCYLVLLLFLSYHSILNSELGFGLERVTQIPGSLAYH